MIIIGLDIGSTTISAVAIDAITHETRECVTQKHQATMVTEHTWEHTQDPVRLADLGCNIINTLSEKHGEVAGIGLSGQMHGILYVDAEGKAVSPFYTWQDRRAGSVEADGSSLLDMFTSEKHPPIREGYGFATHLWNIRHGCVPTNTRWITTISGFIAMRLTNANYPPVLHPSEAASLGFFDLKLNCYDWERLQEVGIDASIIPRIAADNCFAGYTPSGIPVYCGLGDNQASFLGSVENPDSNILLNIGTGSQITRKLNAYIQANDCEIRPFIDNGYIAVGSGLCGGRAFALLESFIRSCAAMTGNHVESVYDQMTAILQKGTETDLRFDTTFCGTRQEPQQRASISNLSPENFTAEHFVRAVLRGIIEELYQYFQELRLLSDTPVKKVFCSGNLVRLTPEILQIVEDVFKLPTEIAPVQEEAAFGAALFATKQVNSAKVVHYPFE